MKNIISKLKLQSAIAIISIFRPCFVRINFIKEINK